MDDRSSADSSPVQPLSVRVRHAVLLGAAALAAAVLMTWPLAAGIGHLGRTQNSGDGRFAVWNVAWVAHALVTDPADLFDANIFYPHRRALAFSEANIGAGTLAVPVWVATKNPFAAHNSVVLFAFALSVVGAWLLARKLTNDGAAAATAAVLFAFCPYVFSHTAHIQLLMVAGIPICLLLFHRLADAPSPARGVALGLALAAQALSCAYYGISAGLTVGYADALLRLVAPAVDLAAVLDCGDDRRRGLRRVLSCRSSCLISRFRKKPASPARSTMPRSGRRTGARISPRARTPSVDAAAHRRLRIRRCSFPGFSRSCWGRSAW